VHLDEAMAADAVVMYFSVGVSVTTPAPISRRAQSAALG
jgi:hypothetical protein